MLLQIVACIVFVSFPLGGHFSASAFEDTTSKSVNFLRNGDVIEFNEEDTNFYPKRFIVRADLIVWALRNAGYFGDTQGIEPYVDVTREDSFAPYVAYAWEMGIIDSGREFFPGSHISASESLKFIFRIEGMNLPRFTGEMSHWKDIPDDPEEARASIMAVELGIWDPIADDYLGVGRELSREDAADILYRISLLRRNASQNVGGGEVGTGEVKPKEELFDYIWDVIHKKYVYEEMVVDEALMEEAISGMVDSLNDPYTVYEGPSGTESFISLTTGEFEGIGAQLSLNDDKHILIVGVFPDSPAEKAGLKQGDIILAVDGVDATEWTIDEAAQHIRGPSGTEVRIKVLRRGTDKEIVVTRGKVKVEYVITRIEEEILVIEVILFGESTDEDFMKAIEENYDPKLRGIIVDLRGNVGGDVSTVLNMLGVILPYDSIAFWESGRDYTSKRKTSGDGAYSEIPLVVIIDGYSASASEIFAGSVQDNKRGIIVGSQSYGKGTMQQYFLFTDGSSFKMTIAEWLTPLKKVINGVGVTPDVVIEPVEGEDPALEAAINQIKRGHAELPIGE